MSFQQTFTPVLTPNTQVSQSAPNSSNYVMSNTQQILSTNGSSYPETNINLGYSQRTYHLEQSTYSSPPVPQFHPSPSNSSYAPFVSIPPPMPNTHIPPLYHNPSPVSNGYPVAVPQEQFVSQTTYFSQIPQQTNHIPWNVPHTNTPTSFSNYPNSVHPKPDATLPPSKKVALSKQIDTTQNSKPTPSSSSSSSATSQSQTIPRETFATRLKPSGVELSAILEGAPSIGYLVEFNIRGQTYKGFVLNSSLYQSPVDFMPKDFQYQQMIQHQQQVLLQNGNEARNTISLKELEGAEKVIDVGRTIVSTDIKNQPPTKESQSTKELPNPSKEALVKETAQLQNSSPKEIKGVPTFKWQCYLCSEASLSSLDLTEHIKRVHGSQSTSPPPLENIKNEQ